MLQSALGLLRFIRLFTNTVARIVDQLYEQAVAKACGIVKLPVLSFFLGIATSLACLAAMAAPIDFFRVLTGQVAFNFTPQLIFIVVRHMNTP